MFRSSDTNTSWRAIPTPAAARATAQIKKREAELVAEFKSKGLGVNEVDRKSFVDAVLKNKPVEGMGFDKKDYDRIVALK